MSNINSQSELANNIADDGRISVDQKINYIDTLRGIAILMVVILHHSQTFYSLPRLVKVATSYCQMGVQLFFVASAFALCTSLDLRRAEQNPFSSFFIRRYFRIAPLYYLGLAFYATCDVAFRYFGPSSGESIYTPINIVSNILFLHGFVLTAFNGIVPGGWSIATEMTFYLIFPVLFIFLKKLYLRAGLWPLYCVTAIAIGIDFTFQWCIIDFFGKGIENNNILYCSIINQLPVFLIGMTIFFAVRYGINPDVDVKNKDDEPARIHRDLFTNSFGFLIFTFIGIILMRSNNLLGDEKNISMVFLPAVSAVSFFFLLRLCRIYVRKIGILEKIGQLSFSMYIFHFVFAWWMTKIVTDYLSTLVPSPILYAATLAFTILCTYGVAVFSRALVEDRFIDYGRRWIRKRDTNAQARDAAEVPRGLP
jgi:peptidoglycan/LPS O-acetylase OafA/YrhL